MCKKGPNGPNGPNGPKNASQILLAIQTQGDRTPRARRQQSPESDPGRTNTLLLRRRAGVAEPPVFEHRS